MRLINSTIGERNGGEAGQSDCLYCTGSNHEENKGEMCEWKLVQLEHHTQSPCPETEQHPVLVVEKTVPLWCVWHVELTSF